ERLPERRFASRQAVGGPCAGGGAEQRDVALRESPGLARGVALRRGDPRIRGGDLARPQPRPGLRPYRLVQIPDRLGGWCRSIFRAGHSLEPARTRYRALVWAARRRSAAAIAYRRGDRL